MLAYARVHVGFDSPAWGLLTSRVTTLKQRGKTMVHKKQSHKDKMDESLGERRGKASTKKQGYKSRRTESTGMKKRTKK